LKHEELAMKAFFGLAKSQRKFFSFIYTAAVTFCLILTNNRNSHPNEAKTRMHFLFLVVCTHNNKNVAEAKNQSIHHNNERKTNTKVEKNLIISYYFVDVITQISSTHMSVTTELGNHVTTVR
jgi:hypothetical protein